jgi:aspartate aminotransferase-like enzyme
LPGEKKLFTPGPLSCSATVKAAMQRDVGSRDGDFIQTVGFIRSELLHIQGIEQHQPPDEAQPLRIHTAYVTLI